MIVVDASAAVSALLNRGAARRELESERLHAPHFIDSEVASAIRRHVARGDLSAIQGWDALRTWQRVGLFRYPAVGLLDRMWELRENVTPYDATYLALAEAIDARLVTADARLARAPGIHCSVTVVPH